MSKTIEVRDLRGGFFWIDNELLDAEQYQTLGPHGLLVYMVLCRHANNGSGECSLLLSTIAKKARIGKASVSRGVGELEKAKLVAVEYAYKQPSVFTLLRVAKVEKSAFPNGTQATCVPYGNENPGSAFHMEVQNNTKNLNNTNSPPLEEKEASLQLTPSEEQPKKRPKKPTGEADPRWKPFIEMWLRYYKSQAGEDGEFTAGDGAQLKRFLKEFPTITVQEFRRWLNYYRLWPKANRAAKARQVLPKLHLHRFGPLDEFTHPKQQPLAIVPPSASAIERHRRQLQEDYSRKGSQ